MLLVVVWPNKPFMDKHIGNFWELKGCIKKFYEKSALRFKFGFDSFNLK